MCRRVRREHREREEHRGAAHTARPALPAVSVVMPVLNEERYLADAVAHVLEQDYPAAVEVVLAVGPSRDRTLEVAHALAAADPRIAVVENPSGQTPAGVSLNAAIAASHNPVVARVDGHALLPPGYLRIAAETLAATAADNVGGIMAATGVTPFEQAVARAMTAKVGVGAARFHTRRRGAGPPSRCISAYSCARRSTGPAATTRRSCVRRTGS